jgi:dimethylamine monooxygenase subunit A
MPLYHRVMDFEPSLIHTPFRMQPGLSELAEPHAHLSALKEGGAMHRERLSSRAHALHQVLGFDDSGLRQRLAPMAASQGMDCPDPAAPDFWPQLSLCVQEDFALLDTSTGLLPWLHVCNPTRWAPEEKVGLSFKQIHAPVADAQNLQRAAPALLSLLGSDRHWVRHVWTLTPHAAYDLHPKRCPALPWPEASAKDWLGSVYLRVERQTFFPLGESAQNQVVFTIRVMRERLSDWLQSPLHAQRLRDALASMSPAVQQYKGLGQAMPNLLKHLDEKLQTWAQ